MVALEQQLETTMQKTKKLLAFTLAAVAIATASLALSGDAFAKGGSGGGSGHHFSHFHRGVYFSSPVVVDTCWRWFGGKRVWVCSY
jgi:hypothetical protein